MGTNPHYMDRYRARLSSDIMLMQELLEAVFPTLDGADCVRSLYDMPESLRTRIGRMLGLIRTDVPQRVVSGFPVPGYEMQELMLTRLPFDGRPGFSSYGIAGEGAYYKYDVAGYLLNVLAEDRMIDLTTYEERFVRRYEVIAFHFLPPSHALRKKATELRKEITPEPKEALRADKPEPVQGATTRAS